jgi:tight adherence protein C
MTLTLLLTCATLTLVASGVAGPPGRVVPASATPQRQRCRRPSARSGQRRVRELADLIDLFIVAAHAGCTPVQALVEIADAAPPSLRSVVGEIVASLSRGVRFADAVQHLPVTVGPVAQPFADALRLADVYGLPLAPVLDQLATDVRQQRRRAADAAARQLPVRMAAPLVLCHLSSFVVMAIVPLLLGALSSLSAATVLPIDSRSFR